MPIQKNKIVFVNYNFKGYGDNPKYIAEEIRRQGLPCKLIWLVQEDYNIPSYIKKVYLRGVTWYYELCTAGVIISNVKNQVFRYYIKKENQYYLQTWHGDFPLKFIEKEVEGTLSPNYVAASKADSSVTNAIVSGNKQFSKILKESFWLPKECTVLEYGLPRNDIYFKDNGFRDKLKQKLGISLNEKVLLYAPTFRNNMDMSYYNLDFERLRKFLCQIDNISWTIIIRMHPNISSKADLFQYNNNIIDGSAYPDQQELCVISDYLITDYSSIMGDFLLMRKPVFLYVPDLERYSDKALDRGLREMYYHLPFSSSQNQEDLEAQVAIFDYEDYIIKAESFMSIYYNTFDDGRASERVVEYLKNAVS